ncbi:unnamed protein product [Pseudo-nitzschia multistriata]|uniref:Uncharacterized protein n=1 Tax=Pseudo-nitzschia multistriata TaxID=183589 RepID=A0A448ZDU2_9STRA|nr:unnamed protein product [Pseudo-nitzschia multistriata]
MSLTDDHPHDIGDNEVPTVFMGEYGEESDTDRSSEIDGDETGFAAQLRKQRKQVLEKDAMANGFASDLRKHREQFNLVNVDDEAEDVTGNTFDDVGYFDGHNSTLAASAGDGMNGTAPGEVHSELTDGIFEKGRNNNHICSGSLKSELRINEDGVDDGLREFDTTSPSLPERPINEIDDEDHFGDFDKAQIQIASPEENDGGHQIETPTHFEPKADENMDTENDIAFPPGVIDMGNDANEVAESKLLTSGEHNVQSTLEQIETGNENDYNNNIIEEIDAALLEPEPSSIESQDSGDDFRDLNAGSLQYELPNQAANEDGHDDACFHDLDAALSQLDESNTENQAIISDNYDSEGLDAISSKPQTPKDENECIHDNVEDLDAGPSDFEPSNIEIQATDDDFGEFDADLTQDEQLNVESQASHGANDGAFGDFGAAPAQPEPSTVEKQADDDFGEFDAALPQSEPSEVENEASGNDDNDDDFGDFDAAPMSIEPSDHVNAAIIGDNDDAFGNFGAATVEPSTIANEGDDDDDFGDFGAAPTQTNNGNGEKCDDDFGDFDAAPPLESNAPSVDGETFSDFATVPPKSKDASTISNDFGKFDTPPEILTPMAPIGRISDRARNIFAKMQTLHAFSDEDRESTHDNEYIGKGSLSTFLASINSRQEAEDSREENDLDQLLAGAPTSAEDSCSPLVANEDGGGPYGCFIYPSTGLHAPRNQFQDEKLLRRKSSIRKIPDVLPIRLPVGKESPLDTASPAYECDGKKGSTELFQLAKLEVSGGAEDSSEKIQRFQLKIPDLSFMLQSRLQLPTS